MAQAPVFAKSPQEIAKLAEYVSVQINGEFQKSIADHSRAIALNASYVDAYTNFPKSCNSS